jgi:hypothetical protein
LKDSSDDHLYEYVRCLYRYSSLDDVYYPCRELGIHFENDQILEIIDKSDSSWWQAFPLQQI